MLRQIGRICDILGVPASRAALLGRRPKSVASALLISQLQTEGVSFCTIIDGGANVGQFARAALDGFPEATVHSFEPSPATAAILRRNLRDAPRLHVHQAALGCVRGEAEFRCNSNSQTSSILSIRKSTAVHAGIREVESVTVPVTTLDAFAVEYMPKEPLLLKLDLQGYELEALKGATKQLLPRCSHVLVESVFDHLYEGEPLFDEILEFLVSQDFAFLRPLAFLKDSTGRIVQMDALFRRRGAVQRTGITKLV